MNRRRVAVIAGIAAASAATIGLAPGAAAQDDEQVTLTIGLLQDLDTPNLTAGYLVPDFELWNLQYATLTDKSADDFSTIPSLAESWEASNRGRTYTYTLRDGLQWSDGEPLTAEDIAYTINRSRDEEWLNHSATTVNLDATAIDDRTVEITSSVPDPKLPTMDVYILPKHVYEKLNADEVLTYAAEDGVGSGPYTLENWTPGQSFAMVANPNYFGWEGDDPQIDRIVYRLFDNADAMAAAIQQGEIDAAHGIPAESFEQLDGDENIVAVVGQQGGFSELGMNANAAGIGDGHPALQDLDVRHAIAMAIDREVLVDRILLGLGEPGTTMSPSPDPTWRPEIPEAEALDFDPDAANTLLDEAGYRDTDGDGVREMPDGSRDLSLRYVQRTESDYEPALGEFITGWLENIGIATTVETFDDSQLTRVIGGGNYDLFAWGWTPFVDPDPMLSYFTCSQLPEGPRSSYWNDANWCSEEYDALYEEQKVELDPERRREIVHEMLQRFYTEGSYVVLFFDADLQAYRTDRFEGWLQQPAETGPVLFTNTSPTYVNLVAAGSGGSSSTSSTDVNGTAAGTGGGSRTAATDVDVAAAGSGSDGGSNTGVWIAVAVAAVVLLGGGGFFAVRHRATRDERE